MSNNETGIGNQGENCPAMCSTITDELITVDTIWHLLQKWIDIKSTFYPNNYCWNDKLKV